MWGYQEEVLGGPRLCKGTRAKCVGDQDCVGAQDFIRSHGEMCRGPRLCKGTKNGVRDLKLYRGTRERSAGDQSCVVGPGCGV